MKNISGDILELGCGTGANLEFYPSTLNRLVLTEPSHYMAQKLKAKIPNYNFKNIEILNDKAECLSLSDASFDQATILVSGIILGSALWWLLLSGGVAFVLHHRLNLKMMGVINKISGIIILMFGVFAFLTR